MSFFFAKIIKTNMDIVLVALLNLSGGNGMIVTYSKVAEQRNEECLVGSLELVG